MSPIPIPKNTRLTKSAPDIRSSRSEPKPKRVMCRKATYNKIFVYMFGITYEYISEIQIGIESRKRAIFT
jgi:hypothetical protein